MKASVKVTLEYTYEADPENYKDFTTGVVPSSPEELIRSVLKYDGGLTNQLESLSMMEGLGEDTLSGKLRVTCENYTSAIYLTDDE